MGWRCSADDAFRAVEILAKAIGAHSGKLPGQVERVEAYSLAIGRRLLLSEEELLAVRVAAILMDVGDLAIPHASLENPAGRGGYEFEKWKLHAVAGAQIAQQMGVSDGAPRLVRAHHERWDGTGFPDGLMGEQIPLGARILSIADAMSSLSGGEAAEVLRAGAGRAFDPELVQLAVAEFPAIRGTLEEAAAPPLPGDFQSVIRAARGEESALAQMAERLGNSLDLNDALGAVDEWIKPLVRYDSLILFTTGDEGLSPAYASGDNTAHYCARALRSATGVAIRAAALRQTVSDAWTMAMPVTNGSDVAGVLMISKAEGDSFVEDDLRVLTAIGPKVSAALGKALLQEQAERVSGIDPLSSLPNRRALFLRLDAELARSRRNATPLAVLFCAIDGGERLREPEARRLFPILAGGLRRVCREDDCVARLGDEFVLVLSGFLARDLIEIHRRIQSTLDHIGSTELGGTRLTLFLGAAFHPEDGEYAEDLLVAADRRLKLARAPREVLS